MLTRRNKECNIYLSINDNKFSIKIILFAKKRNYLLKLFNNGKTYHENT